MYQPGLIIPLPTPEDNTWEMPLEVPELTNVTKLSLDCETTGVNPFKDRPVGIAISYYAPNPRKFYFPVAHPEDNFDEATLKRWLLTELAGKDVVFCNAKFDIQILRTWGVDLESIGVRPHDIAFAGALLAESNRVKLGLDDLALRYVGGGKEDFPFDKGNMAGLPAWAVGPYAETDALRTLQVDMAVASLLTKDGLDKVKALEDSIIYVVCEIERNGCRIDVPLLLQWRKEVRQEFEKVSWELHKELGFIPNANAGDSIEQALLTLGITPPATKTKKSEKTSFTEDALVKLKHPMVDKIVRLRRLESLLSKYLDKYVDGLEGDLLRSQYHQLKTDEFGTISGRFSSSGGGKDSEGYTFNAQQVQKRSRAGEDDLAKRFPIRRLFIPGDGDMFFSCDASQIEYRLLAHFSKAPKILKAYEEDPDADFHQLVMDMIKVINPNIDRTRTKNANFGRSYGAGLKKMAQTIGATIEETEAFLKLYDEIFPEARDLLEFYSNEAETKGMVRTLYGRIARFGPQDTRYYSALNRVIQGTAADLFKVKMKVVYDERKNIGITKLRQVVHDEQCGDRDPDPKYTELIQEVFNRQDVQLNVPLRWDLSGGANWQEC